MWSATPKNSRRNPEEDALASKPGDQEVRTHRFNVFNDWSVEKLMHPHNNWMVLASPNPFFLRTVSMALFSSHLISLSCRWKSLRLPPKTFPIGLTLLFSWENPLGSLNVLKQPGKRPLDPPFLSWCWLLVDSLLQAVFWMGRPHLVGPECRRTTDD